MGNNGSTHKPKEMLEKYVEMEQMMKGLNRTPRDGERMREESNRISKIRKESNNNLNDLREYAYVQPCDEIVYITISEDRHRATHDRHGEG